MSETSANPEPGSLRKLFDEHTGNLVTKWANYFPVYERHFAPYVGKRPLVIEIGVHKGGSLQLWKKYFGPGARIVGVDIDPLCAALEEEQVSVRIGDQSDQKFLQALIEEFGAPDIVIDDGSHVSAHQKATFDLLFPAMKSSGVYVVEDLHTNYWQEFGGGLYKASTFIEWIKVLIDEIHAGRTRGALPTSTYTSTLQAISIYESIAVLTKEPVEASVDIARGLVVDGDASTLKIAEGEVVRQFRKRRNSRGERARVAARRLLRRLARLVS